MSKSKATTQKAAESPAREKVSLLDKLKLAVKDYLDRKVDEIQLRKTAEEVNKASKQYKAVQISSLSLKEVVKALNLKHDTKDGELQHVPQVPLPPPPSRSPSTEASIRWIIDTLLLNAHRIAAYQLPHAQPSNVQTERSYKYGPVSLKRERVMLSARPDYRIWYGEDEAVCLNVLIVEAKKTDIESGVAQALGYMGEYLTMPIILYIRKLTR
ncbi:unnamed protein product [Penicillium egyptiacum]|uniref:Uncharacterized protein n=1 Tax=Penicillium egyptiacum TaxID=1303716 RepID=A0A9W4KFB7_9EURO|nr:unnamed protein product [Penicillium egyptiacum]